MFGVVSSNPSGDNFTLADFETPRCQFCTKLPEMSDLCYLGKIRTDLNAFRNCMQFIDVKYSFIA